MTTATTVSATLSEARKIIVKSSDGRETMYYDTLFSFLTNCDNVDLIYDMETGELYYIREDNYIAPEYQTREEK